MTYQLGLSADTLNNVQGAVENMPPPRAAFQPYTRIVGQNGQGAPVEMGPPTLVWRFAFLTPAQHLWLLSYLNGASGNVYVRTSTLDGAESGLRFETFAAVMWRPQVREFIGGLYRDVSVRFSQLVTVS